MYCKPINHLYCDMGWNILDEGVEVSTRGTKSKEIICPEIIMNLNDAQVVTLASRKLKPFYVISEFLWYMSRSLQSDDISDAAPFWDTLKDEDGNIVSNYGYWIFRQEDFILAADKKHFPHPKTRFDKCIEILVSDPESRKAIINIHGVDNLGANPKDTPCTLSLQFLIRNNKLNMVVNMRSNDFVIGFCNDIIQFQLIALMVYTVLKFRHGMMDLKLGGYYHNAASMHIYDRHYSNQAFASMIVTAPALDCNASAFKNSLNSAIKDLTEENFIPHLFHSLDGCSNYEFLNKTFGKWFSNIKSDYDIRTRIETIL